MQDQFFAAINQLCDEKNIPRDKVIEAIEAALKTAYRKDFGNREQELEIKINDKGQFATVYQLKEVVKKVEEPDVQITEADAKKIKKSAKIGSTIKIDVTPLEYGRIAAQSAKQVIIQRIQEAERDIMYETFKDRENELLNARVHRVEGNTVYIDLEKITAILEYGQQIPGERYYAGQRLKLYLDKVIKTTKGPQLLISRSHPSLVTKLFAFEIPEVKEETVEIKGIARDPGVRSKIAVLSNNEKIDAVGSCVGQKGVRIQSIMDELNGERIDIIEYSEDIDKYIKSSLAPAKIVKIVISDKAKHAKVYVNADQRPLAIGSKGQNVRLASILTSHEIDILDIADLGEQTVKTVVAEIKDLKLEETLVEKLAKAGLTQVEQIKGLKAEDLAAIEEIDEKEATEITEAVKKFG